jgi:transposase
LERIKNGKKCSTSLLIIDAQSVKNADTSGTKGYDAGKKISGIKRHIAVDTNGLPHAVGVTAANITDRKGAIEIFEKHKKSLSLVEKVLADGGYTGEPFRKSVRKILNAEVEIAKRNELHKFKVIPKRWVVERSFAWLEKSRRLHKNYERLLLHSISMMKLGFIKILIKRF